MGSRLSAGCIIHGTAAVHALMPSHWRGVEEHIGAGQIQLDLLGIRSILCPLGIQKPLLYLAEDTDGELHLEELGTTKVQDICMAGNAI